MKLNIQNSEFKVVLLKLTLIFFFSSIVLIGFILYGINDISGGISDQNAAIIGKLSKIHPDFEAQIVDKITHVATEADIKKGREILQKYGYSKNMPLTLQPAIKNTYGFFVFKMLLLLFVIFIPIVVVVCRGYNLIYSKVNDISHIAEKVIEGDFSNLLPEDNEGDFYILGHHFNQMSNRMKLNIECLEQEKVFLKNLISDISHQLKTPISTLIVSNELMMNDSNMTEDTRRYFLERSKSQLERIEWLVKSLLKLAMLESGAITFKNTQTLLVKPLLDAVALIRNLADEKNISINIAGDVENAWFKGDEKWTTEAIVNIVKNSIEHTPEGGSITASIEQTQLISRLTISDNGEGINSEDLPRIFDRFYRCKSSAKVDSVGIGLSLSKLIINSQNGNISVKSQKGKGSEFIITFIKTI